MAHVYKSANGGQLRGEVRSSPTGLVFEGVWARLAMTRGPFVICMTSSLKNQEKQPTPVGRS